MVGIVFRLIAQNMQFLCILLPLCIKLWDNNCVGNIYGISLLYKTYDLFYTPLLVNISRECVSLG